MSSQERDHGYGVHFFKVILESTLQDGKMKVPRSFTRRNWDGMLNPVSLRLPNGTEWNVYWVVIDGDVWFRNGWQEFSKYSCLDVSYFLMFRYDGNSRFNVIICDKSGLEINYPSNRGANQEMEEIVQLSDCSLELVKECTPVDSKRTKSSSPASQALKKMKTNPKEEQEDEAVHDKKIVSFDHSNKHMKSGSSGDSFKQKIKAFHEKIKKVFRAENDYFTCVIQKTYAERDLLIIPNDFSKPYLHMEGKATLFVKDDRTWDVDLRINFHGQLTFSLGWKKFLLDNELKIGDVCGFELQKCKEVSFKVDIFRFQEDEHPRTPQFKGHERLSVVSSSSLKTPVSKNDLSIQIKGSPHLATIPFTYSKIYLNESGRFVTFRIGTRSWNVKLLYYETSSSAKFSLGWHQFLKDCNLEEGDVCHFNMIDEENLVFSVSISKCKSST
ncbi:hypothetical protein RJT34_07564 [Clitoria ternatea]|uniref:TF-B3 domain-containing protein n=1 Tax=Clitoria ternatea TaxID=43366 RepID=A0AAN9K5Z7_CLITE